MEIRLKRIADNGDASISLFYIDDVFQCFVIEDEHRTKKVYGEKQKSAGVDLTKPAKKLGTRNMKSRNSNVASSLKIANIPHKLQSNAVLNANK